jgi:hypothetical protein
MHIYAFGSVCRGDISHGSDIDLLAVVNGHDDRFDPNTYSIYSYERVRELWSEGNPFAWHLSLESRLLFSSDESDFVKALGPPEPYRHCIRDCQKFLALFQEGYRSLANICPSRVFELSIIFLSIRNFSTCFSLGTSKQPDFSRNSALHLGADSVPIARDAYHVLERARILCTRGYGDPIEKDKIDHVIRELDKIGGWMAGLLERIRGNDRI